MPATCLQRAREAGLTNAELEERDGWPDVMRWHIQALFSNGQSITTGDRSAAGLVPMAKEVLERVKGAAGAGWVSSASNTVHLVIQLIQVCRPLPATVFWPG